LIHRDQAQLVDKSSPRLAPRLFKTEQAKEWNNNSAANSMIISLLLVSFLALAAVAADQAAGKFSVPSSKLAHGCDAG